jgi:hypothetical protein
MNVCRNQPRHNPGVRSLSRCGVPIALAGLLLLGCWKDESEPGGDAGSSSEGGASTQGGAPPGGSPAQGGASNPSGVPPGGSPAQGGASNPGGAPAAAGSAGEEDEFAKILATYSGWTAVTDAPVNVSEYIWLLCRSPTSAEMEFATSEHGDHRAIREWDNEPARATLVAGRAGEFTPGAAIVKEKWVTKGTNQLVAVGMMIRRENGFDPSAGDWEFAYWEEGKGISRGPSQSRYCADCHASAERGDFVFRAGYRLQ